MTIRDSLGADRLTAPSATPSTSRGAPKRLPELAGTLPPPVSHGSDAPNPAGSTQADERTPKQPRIAMPVEKRGLRVLRIVLNHFSSHDMNKEVHTKIFQQACNLEIPNEFFFLECAARLGINSAQSWAKSSCPNISDVKFSSKVGAITKKIFDDFRKQLALSKDLSNRIKVLEGHKSRGEVPKTLQIKIPKLLETDTDIEELGILGLSEIRANVLAAEKAALEMMLAAKKKKKATIDEKLHSLGFRNVLKEILAEFGVKELNLSPELGTEDKLVVLATILVSYIGAAHVCELKVEHQFQSDYGQRLKNALRSDRLNAEVPEADATMAEAEQDPNATPAKEQDLRRMMVRLELLESKIKQGSSPRGRPRERSNRRSQTPGVDRSSRSTSAGSNRTSPLKSILKKSDKKVKTKNVVPEKERHTGGKGKKGSKKENISLSPRTGSKKEKISPGSKKEKISKTPKKVSFAKSGGKGNQPSSSRR